MKRFLFSIAILILTIQSFAEDAYIPGVAAVYEYPANSNEKQSINWKINSEPGDELSHVCYIRTVKRVKKDSGFYWQLEIIPWVIGKNTIPSIIVNNEVVPSKIIYASIDKKSLYVPPLKRNISYDGLYIRLLIYVIILLIIIAIIIFFIIKRRIIIDTIKLYISILVEQYRLLKKITVLEKKNNWKELDYCIRQYCDRVTNALVHHELYKEHIDYIQAQSLTAAEIVLYKKIPEPVKVNLVNLLKIIERARWQKANEDYASCCDKAKTLPALFAVHVLRGTDQS